MRSEFIDRHWIWIDRRSFRFSLGPNGFTALVRRNGEPFAGVRIKPKGQMMFSERYGGWRGFCLGPLYFRTLTKRPLIWERQP